MAQPFGTQPFGPSLQKIDVCTRSLAIGNFGAIAESGRACLEEIQVGLKEFTQLVEQSLCTPPNMIPRTIVHDLYNSLNVIIGFAEIMIYGGELNSVQRLYAQIIHQIGQELIHEVEYVFRRERILNYAY